MASIPDISTGDLEPVTEDRPYREAKAMASLQVVHSNYVPAQLHRQLQFLDFNVGMYYITRVFTYYGWTIQGICATSFYNHNYSYLISNFRGSYGSRLL